MRAVGIDNAEGRQRVIVEFGTISSLSRFPKIVESLA